MARYAQNNNVQIFKSDAISLPLEDKSVDLVFTSPPYEDARNYDIGFVLSGQDYVDWCIPRFIECLRVCRGLVAWVVEGRGSQSVNWSGVPVLLQAGLIKQGIRIWKPSIYGRFSLPGKFQVLRNNWEWIVCSSDGKKLPWSEPSAMGRPPVCAPGGRTSPRAKNGSRNKSNTRFKQPNKTNAGNIVWCGAVGGGNIGSKLAHENEAPFPEYLAEFFIRSFCPPDGVVLDPFCGSGTTAAVAVRNGRKAIASDVRQCQVDLTRRRVEEANNP